MPEVGLLGRETYLDESRGDPAHQERLFARQDWGLVLPRLRWLLRQGIEGRKEGAVSQGTDLHEQLVQSLLRAVRERSNDIPGDEMLHRNVVMTLVASAYMTGVSQACYVMLRGDGAVDAHLLQRVLIDVGQHLGGHWERKKKGQP